MVLEGVIPLAKKLIRLKGPDTLHFLQGLLTKDVQSERKVRFGKSSSEVSMQGVTRCNQLRDGSGSFSFSFEISFEPRCR